jgi:hypothetical protein
VVNIPSVKNKNNIFIKKCKKKEKQKKYYKKMKIKNGNKHHKCKMIKLPSIKRKQI